MRPYCAPFLLLCVAVFGGTRFTHAADMLQLVVEGTVDDLASSLPDALSAAVLTAFAASEGDGYELLSPGDAPPTSNRHRGLHLRALTEEDRHLTDFGCPNSCSNSGSTSCRSMGCAYCGTCSRRRRLRELQSKQRQIEDALNTILCAGSLSCSLEAKIMRVNDDGTTSPAT